MAEDDPSNSRVGSHDKFIHEPAARCWRTRIYCCDGNDECCCYCCLRRRSDTCCAQWTRRSAVHHGNRGIDRSGTGIDPETPRRGVRFMPVRLRPLGWQLRSRQCGSGEFPRIRRCASSRCGRSASCQRDDHDDSWSGGASASARTGCRVTAKAQAAGRESQYGSWNASRFDRSAVGGLHRRVSQGWSV
jgi:hypothetical protein